MTVPTDDEFRARFEGRLRSELLAMRSASAETAADRSPVTLDQQSVGRLSRMDAMQQQAMAAAQEARRHGRIRALEAALARLASGEFGWCDSCGEFIGEKRLEIDATIMRCRDCAV
ncbi:MAG: TraR/DksA C4-type zinc finger protein [Pseudorhodobacter sp.]